MKDEDVTDNRIIEHVSKLIVQLCRVLRSEQNELLLTLVLFIAHNDGSEVKINTIFTLGQLAPIVGEELNDVFIIPQICSFAEEVDERVRVEMVKSLCIICKFASGGKIQSKIVGLLEKLSKDRIAVQIETVNLLPILADKLHDAADREKLVTIFKFYSQSESNAVKFSLLHIIGKFLNFVSEEKPLIFFCQFYSEIMNGIVRNRLVGANEEIINACAFNFPAFVYFFGTENWDTLKEFYFYFLFESADVRNKKIMLLCLKDIVNVLKGLLKDEDFDRIFRYVTRCDMFEVKLAFAKIIPFIVKGVEQQTATKYYEYLNKIREGNIKWRSKVEISKSLTFYGKGDSVNMIETYILPLGIQYCMDTVV